MLGTSARSARALSFPCLLLAQEQRFLGTGGPGSGAGVAAPQQRRRCSVMMPGLRVQPAKQHFQDLQQVVSPFRQPTPARLLPVKPSQVLSNDRFKAPVHRVLAPRGQRRRYSAPFFFNPAPDATITPLPQVGHSGSCNHIGMMPAFWSVEIGGRDDCLGWGLSVCLLLRWAWLSAQPQTCGLPACLSPQPSPACLYLLPVSLPVCCCCCCCCCHAVCGGQPPAAVPPHPLGRFPQQALRRWAPRPCHVDLLLPAACAHIWLSNRCRQMKLLVCTVPQPLLPLHLPSRRACNCQVVPAWLPATLLASACLQATTRTRGRRCRLRTIGWTGSRELQRWLPAERALRTRSFH
jgi:hypothetical protein